LKARLKTLSLSSMWFDPGKDIVAMRRRVDLSAMGGSMMLRTIALKN
jgi:hypothetical protein